MKKSFVPFLNTIKPGTLKKEMKLICANLEEKGNALFPGNVVLVRYAIANTVIEYVLKNRNFIRDHQEQQQLFIRVLSTIMSLKNINEADQRKRTIIRSIINMPGRDIRKLPHLNNDMILVFDAVYNANMPVDATGIVEDKAVAMEYYKQFLVTMFVLLKSLRKK